MKTCKHLTYTRKIQWRIRALWLLLTGMLVYMVLIAEDVYKRQGYPKDP